MSRRIASFLPAATEMAYALGLGDQLVGVSHECDYPTGARDKPVIVRNAIDFAALPPGDIDSVVSARLHSGESLYAVDEALLRTLEPDLILTQDLCQVCAPSGNDISRLLASLSHQPAVLYFTPKTLSDVWDNLRAVGDATATREMAEQVIGAHQRRLELVAERVAGAAKRPRVFFAEWVDPIYCAGHWVPEMIELAGGSAELARPAGESVRVSWSDVVASAPDVVIVAPCGYSLADAVGQVSRLSSRPGWGTLPAVRNDRVYAVDANAYFARPGPRLVEGVELLAHLLHPEFCAWGGATDAFAAASVES